MALRSQRRVSNSIPVPAPIGGWNARDSIADMDARDAVSLINWMPTATDIMVRYGHSQFATGLDSQVESLPVYNSGTASKMFGFTSTKAYDVSAGGAVGAAVLTGLTNARWQYVNITTSGGSYMLCVNGADKLRGYDGTNWWTDGDGTHDITGVDTATIIDIQLHNNRVWLIQKDTLLAWYLPLNSIAGAATSFDLRSQFRKGGELIAMGAWTIDSGYGLNDQAVFITSQGEAIVYIGIDPSSTATWSKIGLYEIGAPLGNRPFTKWGGDLLLINYDGLTPLAQGVQSSRLDPRVHLTDKIRGAMAEASSSYGANFGWQVINFPKQSMLILNVPVNTNYQEQYVMSTVTKAWTRFQGWPANCWALFNDNLYFGGNTIVGKAWDTLADHTSNINTSAISAFNYFKRPAENKRWTMIRPVFNTDGSPSISAGLNVDFNVTTPNGVLAFTAPGYATWDSGVWDTAVWGGDLSVSQVWQGVNGIGRCAGIGLVTGTSGIETHWVATDYVFETGGIV